MVRDVRMTPLDSGQSGASIGPGAVQPRQGRRRAKDAETLSPRHQITVMMRPPPWT
jgi:hypothetical protein